MRLYAYAAAAADPRGLQVIVAGGGGARASAGMARVDDALPVLGVGESKALRACVSLLSMSQMPAESRTDAGDRQTGAIKCAAARRRHHCAVDEALAHGWARGAREQTTSWTESPNVPAPGSRSGISRRRQLGACCHRPRGRYGATSRADESAAGRAVAAAITAAI
jgi:hypothetical protein